MLIVYNVPKTSAIDFINSKSNVLLTDSAFAQNKSALLFHVKHNWWDLGLNNNKIISYNLETKSFKNKNNFIQFLDKKVLILKSAIEFKRDNSNRLNLDYLIVSNNTKMSIEEMDHLFRVKKIIFDSSNSDYQLKKWKQECDVLNQKYSSVKDLGAIEIEM